MSAVKQKLKNIRADIIEQGYDYIIFRYIRDIYCCIIKPDEVVERERTKFVKSIESGYVDKEGNFYKDSNAVIPSHLQSTSNAGVGKTAKGTQNVYKKDFNIQLYKLTEYTLNDLFTRVK